MASCRCIHMEHANEPCCRAGWSNHVLRMFRTERRSRCHLVPRQAPRCCKAFLAQQRRYWRRRRWVVTRHARKGTNVFAMNASTITAKESGPLVCTAIGQTRRYPYVQPPKYHHSHATVQVSQDSNSQGLPSPRSR